MSQAPAPAPAPGAPAPADGAAAEATAQAVRVETMIEFCGSAAAKRADETDDPAPAECVRPRARERVRRAPRPRAPE